MLDRDIDIEECIVKMRYGMEIGYGQEIVRCKDCKRRGAYDCPVYVGGDRMHSEPDDWFCADGERVDT